MNSNNNLSNGFVLMSRGIIESKIWTEDPDLLKLFLYLIIKARHDRNPKNYPQVTIKRGELITSLSKLSEANESTKNRQIIQWSSTKIMRMLNKLQEDGYIKILNDTYGTHISICNYDIYQNPKLYILDENKRTCNTFETDINNYNYYNYNDDNNGTCNNYETTCNNYETTMKTNNNDKECIRTTNNDKEQQKILQANLDVNKNEQILEKSNTSNNSFKESKSDSLKEPGNGKVKSKKQKAPPDSRVNDVYKFFVENHPIQPCIIVNIPRVKKEIKNVIQAIDPVSDNTVNDIQKLLDRYFKSKDQFYKKVGYDFSTFMRNINAFQIAYNQNIDFKERLKKWDEYCERTGVN